MSFAFMPVYTGDYLRDTQHLSMSEHGCYLKLLMHCWDQKGPAPLDERKLCGIVNARSSDEILALRRVLEEFFTKMDDGWYNHRMQREIERSENISKARSTAGKAGYQAKAKQLLSKSQARASTPTPTPTTTTTPTPTPASQDLPLSVRPQTEVEKPLRASRSALVAPPDVSAQVWGDFLMTRKALKAEVTQTALAGIRREAQKASLSLEEALQMCCARGWRGFRADWVTRDGARRGSQGIDIDATHAILFGSQEANHEAK